MPPTAPSHPLDEITEEAQVLGRWKLTRIRNFGLGLGACSLLFALGAWQGQSHTQSLIDLRLQQVRSTQARVQQELLHLNAANTQTPPEPLALKQLAELGQSVNQQEGSWLWLGPLHQQRLQTLLTQAIEALSRPVSGLDAQQENRLQRERALRLDALPRLQALEDHLRTAQNGLVVLLWVLTVLTALPALVLLFQWQDRSRRNALSRRINTLSLALRTQSETDQTRLGATMALEGVLAAIENTQNQAHKQALLHIGGHLNELKQSGQKTLQFAHAFHKLSTQATQLAKVALTHDQRNIKADHQLEALKLQLEGLREDLRSAALGLRKAGESSRMMLKTVANAPSDADGQGNTATEAETLRHWIEQNQLALKEVIEGLVQATQRINTGQGEGARLSEHMAVSHTAWSNLLEQIEQYAEEAATQSETALVMAKHLIQTTKAQTQHNLASPSKAGASSQAAKAPPQLLP